MDLETYAARIAYAGRFDPTLDTLRALHLAHATHIPFENLDILLGRPIRLEGESLWQKLVLDRRGGYCFEQNSLFASVLEAAGFRVRRPGASSPQFSWCYRIVQEGAVYVLQSARPAGWVDLYSFGLEETYAVDYEVANHFTSTWPKSMFRNFPVVQLPGPDLRVMIIDRTLSERTSAGSTETVLDDEQLLDALAARFDLHFPPGTRFPRAK